MTQGRPPNDEVAGEDRDIEEEPHPGARSQTRTALGERGARTAPRAAFGPASNAPPASTDGDKTVKRPYPTAWGQNLPIGGAAMEEKTKVARSVFSQTLGGEPAPAPQNTSKAPATRSARPEEQEVEPLRVPSQSPSPAPFQQSRGSAARTILMAGAPPAPQPAAPKPAARQPGASAPPRAATEAAKPAPRAPTAAAKRTLALGSADFAGEGGVPAGPEPKDASGSARHEAFGAPRAPNISEPLQLQLDARDVLEHAEVVAPGRSRTPLYAGITAAILIAGAIAVWLGSRDKAAPVAEPSLRGDGVLVQDSPQAVAPAAPAAVQPAAAPAAVPAAAAPAAAAQPQVPAQPAANPPAAAQELEPEAPKAEVKARPEPKPASKPARKRRGSSAAAASDAPVSDDVRSARDALRALDSEPVMKIQRSEDEFDAPAPEVPDTPDLPEPPPPPEE